MSKHGSDYNERRHTNLTNDIYHKPNTTWHPVLIAAVSIIAVSFIVYAVVVISEVAGLV